MTTTQQYSLVMYSLGYISLNTPYHTTQLYNIYLQHKPTVDVIVFDQIQLQQVLATNAVYLPQVIIMDPDAIWGV